jgi:HEPN domain-containing protein
MSDAERLRERSKRMLELASRAYCEKHYDFARLLIQLAAEVLEHAGEMDQHETEPRQRAHL